MYPNGWPKERPHWSKTTQAILKKCTGGHKFSKLQEKINHLMYMVDIKLFLENERGLETQIQTVRIYSQDIRMEFGIEKCAMLVMKSGKRHMTEGIELPNQVIIRTLDEKETNKFLGIFEADTIKQAEMKEKIKKKKKNIPVEPKHYWRQKYIAVPLVR